MELAPFLATIEKLGMFGIAGYLVWNLVQQQRESNTMWHDFADGINRNLERLVEVLEHFKDGR